MTRSTISYTGPLPPNEIHVRAVWLNAGPDAALACRDLLSAGERERADRFAFDQLARSYIIAHGALRLLLAGYLKTRPEDLEFISGRRGKPEIRNAAGLRFNMAHSGELALYAFASDCELGVDVEMVREMPDLETIARHHFSSAETFELLSITPSSAQAQAFFRCWTRKEAYIKAIGEGLYLPLDGFQVTLRASDPVQFVHIGNDRAEAEAWNLHHLDPAPNYTGALAWRGRVRQVRIYRPVTSGDLWI